MRASGKGLERYGRDLTRLAAEGRIDPCFGREQETQRLLADKAYLESLYRQGAEKAAAMANRTLRKVHKKVGFVPR